MAVAAHQGRALGAGPVPSPEELRLLGSIVRLATGLWSIPSVSKVGMSVGGGILEFWVFMRAESLDDESHISALERQFQNAVGRLPFDLHVIPLDQVSEASVPSVEIILER